MSQTTLTYPFDAAPATDRVIDIVPGVQWIRHSLPMALDHINVWLLSGPNACTIVDTGINTSATRDTWRTLLDTDADGKHLEGVIVTHLHPDHCGVAGWLTEHYLCPLYMTRTEYLLCRTLCHDSSLEVPEAATRFYHEAGLTPSQLDDYARAFGGFGRAVTPLPPTFRRLQDGDSLSLYGHDWSVLVGTGHSPEHACLLDRERNVLISGDQILPRISSIIAVWPTEPHADPLSDWLDSCRDLIERLPPDVLVLPSHGLPFYGAHGRLAELIEHHEDLIEKLYERSKTPQRAIDVFDLLFNSRINDSNRVMAVGETLAHYNYLLARGKVTRQLDHDGVAWYRQD